MKQKISLILFLILHLNGISQNLNQDSIKLMDSFFNENIKQGKLAGAVSLIAVNGEIQHLKSYGFIDLEDTVKMHKDVLIPIASMTKVFTSIAILQLQEKGMLHIDVPIEKYIPEFKNLEVLQYPDSTITEELKRKPTIKDFLRHTSGMVYTMGNSHTDKLYLEAGFREWNKSLPEFVKKLTEIPLAFQPGEKWEYSYSIDILGYLVEVISGMPLNEYCKKHIFMPLGLKNTDFYVPQSKSDRLSDLYIYKNNQLELDDDRNSSIYHIFPNAISGGGGWWSSYGGIITTIEDYYILSNALLNFGAYDNSSLLKKESVLSMISNQIGELNAFGNKYGLGIGVQESESGLTTENLVFWSGSPYNSYFWIDYKSKTIGILFTNTAPFGHLNIMGKFREFTLKALSE